MLEFWYREKRTLLDFRRGPLGPHFDGLAAQLRTEGYSSTWARVVLGKSCLFNSFLIDHKIDRVADLSQSLADAFLAYHRAGARVRSHLYAPGAAAHAAIKHLFNYLITSGVWAPPKPKMISKVYDLSLIHI